MCDRILQHSIKLYGLRSERTLEVVRSMLRRRAPLLFLDGILAVMDALKENYGSVYLDYMLIASEMLCIVCLDMKLVRSKEILLLKVVIELKSALDVISLNYRTLSL